MRKISLLGSTGSIGCNTLEVLKNLGPDYQVTALAANNNVELLSKQIKQFSPRLAVVGNPQKVETLKKAHPKVEIMAGLEGLIAVAEDESDMLVNGILGSIGLIPTARALKKGKRIGLANKESMVAGGHFLNKVRDEFGGEIIPVDSEHFAIFQSLQGHSLDEVENIWLTASGGPFLQRAPETFKSITLADALNHPTWNMGKKITIDSATLMNKGLEVLEAHYLFRVPFEQVQVVIHPQSIIHSLVEYVDGEMIAQLGMPDMKIPIQHSITYPRIAPLPGKRLNLAEIGRLDFSTPDRAKFPCLPLAYHAGKQGGMFPAVLNAANEVVVQWFLEEKITFNEIPQRLSQVLDNFNDTYQEDEENILAVDKETRLRLQQSEPAFA